jgi:hypothetical protein
MFGALLLVLIFKVASWCANYTDRVGKVYAHCFLWLQHRGLTLVRARLPSVATTNKDARTFIASYSKWFYWVMCLDECRMRAYEAAVARERGSGAVWVDVGTGAHMPLTRMLLSQRSPGSGDPAAAHVHAVESNPLALESARALRHSLPAEERDCITVHGCYSSQLAASALRPAPDAIIHEIVGTVASSEGAVSALSLLARRLPRVTRMIPHRFATLCMPVSHPSVSLVSSAASLLFGGTCRIQTDSGVQCLYNPPRTAWLACAPAVIEEYTLEGLRAMTSTVHGSLALIPVGRSGHFSGLYLAPLIHCASDGGDPLTTVNGLTQVTNWGVEYVSFGQHLPVEVGDKLSVSFTVDFATDCPSYSVGVRLVSSRDVPSSPLLTAHWRGPQDNMLI